MQKFNKFYRTSCRIIDLLKPFSQHSLILFNKLIFNHFFHQDNINGIGLVQKQLELSLSGSIQDFLKQNNINLKKQDVNKIQAYLNELELGQINEFLGFLYEKLINKKEIGAYYTSSETTEYVVNNCLFSYLLSSLKSLNNNIELHLFETKKKDNDFIISSIQHNHNLSIVLDDIIQHFGTKDLLKVLKSIKIADISCGSGSFLFCVSKLLKVLYTKCGVSKNQSFSLIYNHNLYGLDIDREAIEIVKFRIVMDYLISNVRIDLNFENFKVCDSLLLDDDHTLEKSFDIVLGNPPYIENRNLNNKTLYKDYNTYNCKNIYAYFLERNMSLLKDSGMMGMIVPISYTATKRMKPIRESLLKHSKYHFCASFADRPSSLFVGVHQKINIILLEKGRPGKKHNYTTSYYHWNSTEKETLFKDISYVENKFDSQDFMLKVGSKIESSIIGKLLFNNYKKSLIEYIDNNGSRSIFVNMRIGFFNKSFSKPQTSKEYREFKFLKREHAVIFNAFLNSNIFFFIWESVSDCWHLTMSNLSCIKLNFDAFTKEDIHSLNNLLELLEGNLIKKRKPVHTKQTAFEYQHKKEKIIMDDIDMIFQSYFKLTNQELDFLKQYQLKYRLNDEYDNYIKLVGA